MALQSKRRTSTSKKQRASHFALKKIALARCGQCSEFIRPHRLCPNCGAYQKQKRTSARAGK